MFIAVLRRFVWVAGMRWLWRLRGRKTFNRKGRKARKENQLRCRRGRPLHRQRDQEHCATSWSGAGFNLSSVLSQDRLTDAQAEAGAATWALGGVGRIANARQHFGGNAGPVILKGDDD